jgi:hypothetical protein
MNKKTQLYLLVAFIWTWCGSIGAYLISRLQSVALSTDYTIFRLLAEARGGTRFLPQLVFSLAVYGPLIGFLVTGGIKISRVQAGGTKRFWFMMLLIPFVSVIPTIGFIKMRRNIVNRN